MIFWHLVYGYFPFFSAEVIFLKKTEMLTVLNLALFLWKILGLWESPNCPIPSIFRKCCCRPIVVLWPHFSLRPILFFIVKDSQDSQPPLQRWRHCTTLRDMEGFYWQELEKYDTELQHFPVKILFGWMFISQGIYFSSTPEMKTTFIILIEFLHKE